MQDITICHNPQCSKSRQTLALLRSYSIEPTIIHYLETPPSTQQLRSLLKHSQLSVQDIIRTKEPLYQELNIADLKLDDDELLVLLSQHPILIERPIVYNDTLTVIGRPPENVLELLL